jgi:hypothetical protein
LKIFSPATNGVSKFLVQLKPGRQLFIGSSFKTFVLCEELRLVDSAKVIEQLTY